MYQILFFILFFIPFPFLAMEREKRALEAPQTQEGPEKLQRLTPLPELTMDLVARPLDFSSGFASLPIEISLTMLDEYFDGSVSSESGTKRLTKTDYVQAVKTLHVKKLTTLKSLNRAHYRLIRYNPKFSQFFIDLLARRLDRSENTISKKLNLPAIQTADCQKWIAKRDRRNEFTKAVKQRTYQHARELLEKLDINEVDRYGNTLLLTACEQTDEHCDEDYRCKNPVTPADESRLQEEHAALIKDMLVRTKKEENTSIINYANIYGETPLRLAIVSSHFQYDLAIVDLIIEAGADLEEKDDYGNTPLIEAATINLDALKKLLNKKVQVDTTSKQGRTALMTAAISYQYENGECIEELLKAGSQKDKQDKKGNMALHYICNNIDEYIEVYESDLDAIDLLIDANTINHQNEDGQTPLMLIAKNYVDLQTDFDDPTDTRISAKELAEFLVQRGALLHLKDKEGKTALDIARESGNQILIEYLLHLGSLAFIDYLASLEASF